MTRRTLSVALIALGVIVVLAAIASATIWRPTDTATLSLPTRPETSVVVSDPGVLDAVGPDVRIEATAGGEEPVVLAVGRTADVDAWVGTAAHTRITGLASWEELEVTDVAADEGTEEATDGATAEPAEPAALPNPAGSDLWVVEQTGTGTAQLDWADRDGRWSLLAATDGTAPAPEVSLTWDVEVRTPWLVPGLIVGGLLVIAGVALLVLQVVADREARRRPARAAAGADAEETAVLPAAGAPLTRRELRERERAEARRQRRGRTGEIPVVATTGEIPVAADTDEISAAGAPARALGDAGAARGAGIVPASARAPELRAAREPEDGHGTDDARSAGVARGAGIVPASDRAAQLRAARGIADEPGTTEKQEKPRTPADAEAARWTEGETTGDATAAMPAVGTTGTGPADDATAAMPAVGTTNAGPADDATAAMPAVGTTNAGPADDATAAMPAVGTTGTGPADDATAAMPAVGSPRGSGDRPTSGDQGPTGQHPPAESGEEKQSHEREGWRSLWGFGSSRKGRPTDEEEQR